MNGKIRKELLLLGLPLIVIGLLGVLNAPEQTSQVIGALTILVFQIYAMTTVRKDTAVIHQNLKENSRVGEEIHTILSKDMGVQFRLSAVALRRIAELTRFTADIQAAEEAEGLYKDYLKSLEGVLKSE
jgi:hypothetical protein